MKWIVPSSIAVWYTDYTMIVVIVVRVEGGNGLNPSGKCFVIGLNIDVISNRQEDP